MPSNVICSSCIAVTYVLLIEKVKLCTVAEPKMCVLCENTTLTVLRGFVILPGFVRFSHFVELPIKNVTITNFIGRHVVPEINRDDR